jgi:hypothetical protein
LRLKLMNRCHAAPLFTLICLEVSQGCGKERLRVMVTEF